MYSRAIGDRDRVEIVAFEIVARAKGSALVVGRDRHGLLERVEHADDRAAEEARDDATFGAAIEAGHFVDAVDEVPREISDVRSRDALGERRRRRWEIGVVERGRRDERIDLLHEGRGATGRVAANFPRAVVVEHRLVARAITEDRVTCPARSADDALEQERRPSVRRATKARVRTHGRQRVGRELQRRRHREGMPSSARARGGSTGVRPIDRA